MASLSRVAFVLSVVALSGRNGLDEIINHGVVEADCCIVTENADVDGSARGQLLVSFSEGVRRRVHIRGVRGGDLRTLHTKFRSVFFRLRWCRRETSLLSGRKCRRTILPVVPCFGAVGSRSRTMVHVGTMSLTAVLLAGAVFAPLAAMHSPDGTSAYA